LIVGVSGSIHAVLREMYLYRGSEGLAREEGGADGGRRVHSRSGPRRGAMRRLCLALDLAVVVAEQPFDRRDE
jgi:hypothetical protein